METIDAIARILQERLEPFNVPVEIRNNIIKEFLALMGRPERNKLGSTVFTAENSIAADLDRKNQGLVNPNAKPKVI